MSVGGGGWPTGKDLGAVVGHLEAREEIRQLACRWALAVDQRDLDTLVALYAEDAPAPDGKRGRAALAAWFDRALRSFTTSFHLVGGHSIDLGPDGTATGRVSCRAEQRFGDRWVVALLQHQDRYASEDGRWAISERVTRAFSAVALGQDPAEVPGRFDAPGHPFLPAGAELPEAFDTWAAFWSGEPRSPA